MKREKKINMARYVVAILLLSGCTQPESNIASFDGNQSPVIKKISADKIGIKSGEFTTLTVEAFDPDGEELDYSWHAFLGDIIGSGSSVRYTASYCCVGVNTINVTVTDAAGAKVSQSINIQISPS
ncbi:MAG: hypothetical protein HYZ10_06475 [Ignavibacteriales bacterium]|nr:hypothetical protein [Ignavibacteriales bacterium]